VMASPSSPSEKAPTIDEHLDAAGFGWYQIRIFCIMSLLVVADGMEMTVLSMLRKPLQREYGLDDYGFAALGSGTRAPEDLRCVRTRALPPSRGCSC
jgi:hypothetical protein